MNTVATLVERQDFLVERIAREAFADLLQTVLGTDLAAHEPMPCGMPFAFFEPGGTCVASVDCFSLTLVLGGTPLPVAAFRAVAVHPAWRGQGLFRRLMSDALAWSRQHIPGPALLYTAEPDLYRRFGFRECAQHKYTGPPPASAEPGSRARPLLRNGEDDALLARLLKKRGPVSNDVAIVDAPTLFRSYCRQDTDVALDYIAECDALIVSEQDDAGLFSLIDIVAAEIPSLATILQHLGCRPAEVEVLFPPDRLDWSGIAVPDDTGLMIAGTAPPAFARPFMFAPTAGF